MLTLPPKAAQPKSRRAGASMTERASGPRCGSRAPSPNPWLMVGVCHPLFAIACCSQPPHTLAHSHSDCTHFRKAERIADWGQRHKPAIACFKEPNNGIFFFFFFSFSVRNHLRGSWGATGDKRGHYEKSQWTKCRDLAAAAPLSWPLSHY